MILAFPSSTNDSDCKINNTFGRSPYFLIVDTETNERNFIPNTQNLNAVQGAGIQSAQNLIKSNVNALITKHCGPKAFKVLKSEEVQIFITEEEDIDKVIELYKQGRLTTINEANVSGHWM